MSLGAMSARSKKLGRRHGVQESLQDTHCGIGIDVVAQVALLLGAAQ